MHIVARVWKPCLLISVLLLLPGRPAEAAPSEEAFAALLERLAAVESQLTEIEGLRAEVQRLRAELARSRTQTTPAPPGQPAPAPAADWTERVDVGAQVRARFEGVYNYDFDDKTHGDSDFTLLRTRVHLLFRATERLKLFVQFQDARTWGTEASTAANSMNVDLKQGWFAYRWGENSTTLKVGRQVLSYGDQRLVGGFEWSNTARSFDAARLAVDRDRWRVDVFVSTIDETFGAGDDEFFSGVYGMIDLTDRDRLEPYLFWRRNNDPAPFPGMERMDVYTLGVRAARPPGAGFDYGFEAAWQTGDYGSLDVEAYAAHGRAGFTFAGDHQPRIGVEANVASGDKDATDDEWNRFDNLFPTNHLHYGYMDLIGWRNMKNLRLTFSIKPSPRTTIQVDAHRLALMETADAWLSAGGATLRGTLPGARSDLGEEVDFLFKFKHSKNLGFLAGYSHFFPGPFLEDTGTDDDADFLYIQAIANFP